MHASSSSTSSASSSSTLSLHHFFHRHLTVVSPSSHYHYSFRCLCSLFHHVHSHVWRTLANECGSGGAVVLWYERISSFVLILSCCIMSYWLYSFFLSFFVSFFLYYFFTSPYLRLSFLVFSSFYLSIFPRLNDLIFVVLMMCHPLSPFLP